MSALYEQLPDQLRTQEGLRTIANYLRSTSHGVKTKQGVQHDKRVDYFKGKKLIEKLLEDHKKWPKTLPKIQDKGLAIELAGLLLKEGFFHRSEKAEGKSNYLTISKKNVFEPTGHYTWIWEGNKLWNYIFTTLIVVAVIGFTLLPIWPDAAKRILWWFSVTFLIATLSFCLIRFVLFLVLWILGYEFWIFPNLFDESLSFQDSFKPMYSFIKGSKGQGYYRIGLIVAIIAFVSWACTQPTEFDGMIQAQKHFLDDLYSGKLLADVAQETKDNIDKVKKPKVPTYEELQKEQEEEEARAGANISDEEQEKAVFDLLDSLLEKEDEE
jgi:translocation protein SEC62